MTASFILPSAATLELFALKAFGSNAAADAAPTALNRDWLYGAMIALPVLLALGMFLFWALSLGKKETPLRVFFSRGGSARLVLLLSWIALASLVDELVGRPPFLLVIGLAAVALFGWRKPRFLACGAVAGSASVAIADLLVRGRPDAERLLLAAAAAVLSVAIGKAIRNAFLRSADRLSSLEKENKKLWELSFHDGLTGLFNRRYTQEVGEMLFARAKRYNEHLHVLMLDIDRFKLVNDKLGHPVGDEVLKDVAGILVSQVRASDVVTRYGGEEFLIFLIQTEPEVVQFIANRIRDGIAAHAFPAVPWQLTISIGVAGIKADDTLAALVDRSDKYLYASKRGGRNRVSGF
jgi:diguanylate cyclase (GGDEF)-like protein